MKTDFFTVSLLAGLVAAGPIAIRQLGGGNSVSINAKEYSTGGCKPIIFFFARGSAEIGTMGSIGPPTGQGLKSAFGAGNVAVEGISYAAALGTNAIPGGADPAGITAMKNLLNGAASKCPTSILVAGGYSQGAALTHRAIENLSEDVKARIAGVVTFGDSQNKQDNGQIPNFPKDKLLIICNSGDAICQGILSILPAHLDYVRKAPEAVTFLTGKIKAAQGSGAEKTEKKTQEKTEKETQEKTEKKTQEKTEKETQEKTEKKTQEKTEKETQQKAQKAGQAFYLFSTIRAGCGEAHNYKEDGLDETWELLFSSFFALLLQQHFLGYRLASLNKKHCLE
ncbi:uncharacterized protein L3040_008405 [Drepanopeziza brunnea f. sp. 'multigermtubi']|uniref:uncharacterized protein n=1 Tax=Drepanopeziza brunnea f. sp. 'multigermtubi' TaxID=698441 RepID=UPI002388ACF0|nr:hypothetical protein L3040_008405 [Drepanopeziza brunnea f. sp. 'multigermtubi']